jgi:peptidoglycan/LPS O-acetylase OafA/YrhL
VAWSADAIAWDVLFVLAVIGGVRARVPLRDWIFPAAIVLGTAAALIIVPGAPGNDDRHRSGQAVPLLVVFAVSWFRARQAAVAGAKASRPHPRLLQPWRRPVRASSFIENKG